MNVVHSLIACELYDGEDGDLTSSAIPHRFHMEVVTMLRFLSSNDPKEKLPNQINRGFRSYSILSKLSN